MPTYQYSCPTCEYTVSQLIPLSEEIKTPECLHCKTDMQRVFGIPSVTFKGSGWGSDQ